MTLSRDLGPARNLVGYGRDAPRVAWPNGAHVALQLVVNYEEGSEYTQLDGDGRNELFAEIGFSIDPSYRDLAVESVYEYGSRAGIWRVLRMLDEYQLKVTFFAAALAIERNPQVGQWIRESGHEACSHGWRWIEHWLLSRDVEREQISLAVESLRRTCGNRPEGWYCR